MSQMATTDRMGWWLTKPPVSLTTMVALAESLPLPTLRGISSWPPNGARPGARATLCQCRSGLVADGPATVRGVASVGLTRFGDDRACKAACLALLSRDLSCVSRLWARSPMHIRLVQIVAALFSGGGLVWLLHHFALIFH